MTGETLRDLLKPLIGQPGTGYLLVKRIGQVGLAATESSKLTSVEVTPDGLVRLERATGWTVIDPKDVIAVGWNGEPERSAGQFL